jgi:protein-S-isoprenylcysteine O-methyltransferase Ste14
MKASAWEFRFRFWILLAIYTLGFTAPWDAVLHLDGAGPNSHVWGQLAVLLSRIAGLSITAAFNVILMAAIVCAAAGAWLRIWGAAYLSHSVVHDGQMRADSVVAAGPYRYLRNPLYVGSWLNTLALTLLLRPSGAAFMVVGIVVFLLRLILAEEAHLRETLGEAYLAYCARVPRIYPALRPRVTADEAARAQWGRAAAAEVYMWMSAAGFAVLGWRYDAHLLIQCVLVSLGVSLVVKGIGPRG